MIVFSVSCTKDKITQDSSSLSFSTDTVLFDTVFTKVGTATRNFKVYNNSNKTLKISSIRLATANSPFRINVDGLGGKAFTDVEILPKDSIWIFVDANIDPNGGNLPLIVTDSILFETGGVTKDIDLVAWGQDAIYYRPEEYIVGIPMTVLRANTTWTKAKPIVIYGYVTVDSAFTLTIEAGTRIHFHSSSGLWIYKGAHIAVNGTKDEPVIFQGDRLEAAYKDNPGQWDRIWINAGDNAAQDNVFNYAIIKNGLIGIQVEPDPFNPVAPTSPNKLILKNCIIQNHSGLGLFSRNFRIDAENTVIANGGQYCVGINTGGEYHFNHVTIVDYFGQANRKTPAFYLSNAGQAPNGQKIIGNLVNSTFTNCIIFGSIDSEFEMGLDNAGTAVFEVKDCIIKRKDAFADSRFSSILYNTDPKFKSTGSYDFHLLAGSPAIDKANSTLTTDLDGNSRNGIPDLGAYEFIP
ncbi:MAG: choice-of-anchor Q domain-containing protein [Bacteroidota bacterium]